MGYERWEMMDEKWRWQIFKEYEILDLWHLILELGDGRSSRDISYGIWHVENGIWDIKSGICDVGYGIWNISYEDFRIFCMNICVKNIWGFTIAGFEFLRYINIWIFLAWELMIWEIAVRVLEVLKIWWFG